MVLKKIMVLITAMALCFTSVSCIKKPEQRGEAGDIAETVQEEKEEAPKSKYDIFTRTKEPFGYTYKKRTIERAKFSMEIPSGWKLRINTNRNYNIVPDAKDKRFNDVGFHMLMCYDPSIWDRGRNIDENIKLFNYELPAVNYITGAGNQWSIMSTYSLNNMIIDAEWCSEKERVIYGENTDSQMDDLMSTASDDLITMYYYVKWLDDVFVCYSAVTPKDLKAQTKMMLEYMISSSKYVPETVKSYQEITLNKFNVKVPGTLNVDKYDKGLAIDPITTSNITSGIALYSGTTDGKVSREDIESALGANLMSRMLPGSSDYSKYCSVIDEEQVNINGITGTKYKLYASLDIFESGIKADEIPLYRIPTNFGMAIYALDNKHVISLIYQDGQKKTGKIIENSIKNGTFG